MMKKIIDFINRLRLIEWLKEYPRKWFEGSLEWLKENWDYPYWKLHWIYKDIRGWIYYNFNKYHWRLIKEAFMGYPFDYAFIYELDREKLIEMREYFKRSNWIEYESYQKYIHEINKAVACLDILINDDPQPENVYINTRNWRRFRPDLEKADSEWLVNFLDKFPGEIRTEKARRLYYKILLEKSQCWWD